MALATLHFESKYLKNNQTVNIILPDRPQEEVPKSFYTQGNKYKVLWLLHGTFGDYSDWVRKTNIEMYAIERNLMVVMPSGLNSNYDNWPNFMMGFQMFDFLTEELMPLVQGWFPASAKREDNFIAGLSMGARGTIKYAVNHPELFAAAAMLSQAPDDFSKVRPEDLVGDDPLTQRLRTTVENAGGLEQYVSSCQNAWRIIDEMAADGKFSCLPRLLFCVGRQDKVYPRIQAFREHAQKIGLPAEFWEVDGYVHEWRFWDLAIQHALDFFDLPRHWVY